MEMVCTAKIQMQVFYCSRSWEESPEKLLRLQRDSNPWPLRYRCDAAAYVIKIGVVTQPPKPDRDQCARRKKMLTQKLIFVEGGETKSLEKDPRSQIEITLVFSSCSWRSDRHVGVPKWYTKMASAYQTIQNSQFLNYHYFSKFRGIKPKIDKLTNSTQLYPSLSGCYLEGICGHLNDLLVKTIYSTQKNVNLVSKRSAEVHSYHVQ